MSSPSDANKPYPLETIAATPETPTGHRRRVSVPLSPIWTADVGGNDNVPLSYKASPRPVSLPVEELAFFPPLPSLPCETSKQSSAAKTPVNTSGGDGGAAPLSPSRRTTSRRGGAEETQGALLRRQSSRRKVSGGIPPMSEIRMVDDNNAIGGFGGSFDAPPVVTMSVPEESAAELAKEVEAVLLEDQDDQKSVASEFSENTAGSIWEDVPMGPSDAILGIAQAYNNSTDPRKVNVCVGAYRDEQGQPWVLPSVREAERRMLDDPARFHKEYLPIGGDPQFVECAMKFAYGQDMPLDHLAGVQTLSGTGACRIGGVFLATFWPDHPIYVPNPTWGNHIAIFEEAGLEVRRYRYYHKATNGLDLRGMLRDIEKAPHCSIILLHACAHNPTGCDPTIAEWKQIMATIRKRDHIAFFDSAYQGFASGNAEADAAAFRYAVSQKVPILLAQSFAKNFGLYGERCGTLSIVCGDADQQERILSELRCIIRPMYSSPPKHGSTIVKTILQDEELTKQYYQECATMAARIRDMRKALVEALTRHGSKHDWSHMERQIGMFAFTGMTPDMCVRLTEEYAIYLTTNGRISVAGLNPGNVDYVAEAMHAVTDGKSMSQAEE